MFSKNLIYLRKKHNYSQQQLANKIKINQTSIARWEKNDRQPTKESIIKIANIFNVAIGDLLTIDIEKDITNTNHIKIADNIEITIKGEMSIDSIIKVNEILIEELKKQSIQK